MIRKVSETYHLFVVLAMLMAFSAQAQNNVGIGTTTPHPSALLEVSDTSRGMLIPQTDTASVLNYVNGLSTPSTIANGLLIYEVNLKTYVYYHKPSGTWKKLIDLVGAQGPRGARGPQGPLGPTGYTNDWRDSNETVPTLLPRDSCGDYYFHNGTGIVWRVECDPGGVNPRWVDTLTFDNPWGIMRAPDETIEVIKLSSSGNSNEPPAGGGTLNTDVNFFDIAGLNYTITVDIDEVAYVWVVSHGSVSHTDGKNNYSYAQFDIDLSSGGTILEGHGGKFYFDRDAVSAGNMGNIYAISKSGPPQPLSIFGFTDQVGWNVSASYILQGPLTYPEPCDQLCGQTGCPPCPPASFNFTVKTVAGNRVSSGNASVRLWSGFNTVNECFMNVFVLKRRSPNAIPRKR